MEINPLVKKLQIKPAHRVLVVNAPENYESQLEPLPREVQLHYSANGTYDVVQLFVKNSEELKRDLTWLQDNLRPDTIFWISYPKKSSGIESDLGMMKSWDETAKYGLDGVAAASIDKTWTALRFRPQSLVKKSDARNSEILKNNYGEYIDVDNRIVILPEKLRDLLERNYPRAHDFFNSLSYTNKKEYVLWILSAKQEQTLETRINKMIEMLESGKKNPAAK
jgi:hypothetical protein